MKIVVSWILVVVPQAFREEVFRPRWQVITHGEWIRYHARTGAGHTGNETRLSRHYEYNGIGRKKKEN